MHPEAVIDHVHVAFDGLTASLVNITDTMGRLINTRYSLGIRDRGASLLSLTQQQYCSPNSPIGTVVNDPQYVDWLIKVRDLRGRCQHADIDDALKHPSDGPYSRRGEPLIGKEYCWLTPVQDTALIAYGQLAAQAAEDTMLVIANAVCQNPQNPCI